MDHDCSEAESPEFPGLSPSLVGLIIGACAALPMYLWQMSIQAAVACFIIAGYTAWSWAHVHNQSVMRGLLNGELRSLAINRPARRAGRLVVDPGFWWTLVFGGIMVTGSVWYAGIREVVTLAGVAAAWLFIAVSLNYGLTLLHPTTRCRKCAYNLSSQIAIDDGRSYVKCPECGARWSRAQLGGTTTTVDWRRSAA